MVLSFLVPGLGHVYIGRWARAVIWFLGLVVIAGILQEGDVEAWVPIALSTALGVAAAADAWLMMRLRDRAG